jgi:hypothetical protein
MREEHVSGYFLLLQFGPDRTPVVGTGQQSSECKVVFAVFRLLAPGERILHPLDSSREINGSPSQRTQRGLA